jgi:Nickel/cobalt transporter regulator
MLRRFAIAAMFALAVPTVAMAQGGPPGHEHGHPPPGHPGPHMGPPGGPHMGPPGGPHMGPPGHPGPFRGGPFVFHGHPFAWHPVHFGRPWIYPPGYAYRAWAVGAILPPLFWQSPTYYYTGWAGMGLPPPDPGYQYVQYGPDLLLVNVATGQVVQVFPSAFN